MTIDARRRQHHRHAVFDRDGWRCHYCHLLLNATDATADHIVPEAKGGSDALYNLVTSCEPCNAAKADQDPTCACLRCRRAVRKTAAKSLAVAS